MNKKFVALITDYVKNYQEKKQTRTTWREPVIGVAAAADPLFPRLKEIIGPNHALPGELLPGARAVLVFFLPKALWRATLLARKARKNGITPALKPIN